MKSSQMKKLMKFLNRKRLRPARLTDGPAQRLLRSLQALRSEKHLRQHIRVIKVKLPMTMHS